MMLDPQKMAPFAILSTLAALLTLVAAAAGLFVPDFYSYPTLLLLIGSYAQDLIGLLVAPLMLAAVLLSRRGSLRAVMIWLGCLGYLIYGYLLYSFGAVYTSLFPLYIAILGLSLYSLIGLLGRLDANALRPHFSRTIPARAIAVVLAIPVFLIPQWLATVFKGMAAGEPMGINDVLVIDLAFVIPAYLLAAVLVWRRQAWGFVLAGMLLVKMATMGLSLAIGTVWYALRGGPMAWGELPVYLAFALIGGLALFAYLRHLGRPAEPPPEAIMGEACHASLPHYPS